MSRMAAPALAAVLRAADQLEVTIPADLRATLEGAIAAARDATHAQTRMPDLAGLIATAITEGRDPLKDTAVREAAVDHTILTALGPNAITEALANRAAVVATESADDIIRAFKPRYAEMGAQLAQDRATLDAAGVDDLDHARQSVRAGTAAAVAHARALMTLQTLAAIDNALSQLRAVTGSSGSPSARVVAFVDAPNATTSELHNASAGLGHWDVVAKGWTIDLATSDEAAQRYARAHEVQADHDRAAQEAGERAIRIQYGTGEAIRL